MSLATGGPVAADRAAPRYIVMHPDDNVAIVVNDGGLPPGTQFANGLVLKDRVPQGHKVALKDMTTGDTVLKYGVDIGKVVAPIKTGEHAHVHNIKTKRW